MGGESGKSWGWENKYDQNTLYETVKELRKKVLRKRTLTGQKECKPTPFNCHRLPSPTAMNRVSSAPS